MSETMAELIDRWRAEALERDGELEALAAACARAADGQGSLTVIEGEAGIGKSRLLEFALQAGRLAGLDRWRARGSELEREFGFGVALALLEPPLGGLDSDQRQEVLSGAASLAQPLLAYSHSGAASVSDESLHSLLHGLYWLTAGLAESGGVVALIDDAHWADRPSLRFLLYLAERVEDLPIALIVTLRPREPGADQEISSHLASERLARVLRPAPLTASGVAVLVRGGPFPDAEDRFCQACAEVTRGNPFLLGELLDALAAEQVPPRDDAASRVRELGADSLVGVALPRLARAGPEATSLARWLSVLGDGISIDQLGALAEVDPARTAELVSALEGASILAPGGTLAFAHPLVRSSIYGDLSAATRRAMHRRAAELLLAAGAPPDAVARHLLEVPPVGESWALEALTTAGRRSLERGHPDAARRFLARALNEDAAVDAQMGLLIDLGTASSLVGDPVAGEHLREAARLSADASASAEILFGLGRHLYATGRYKDALEVFDEGLAKLDAHDSGLALALEAGYITAARLDLSTRSEAVGRLERLLSRKGATTSSIEGVLLAQVAFERAITGVPREQVVEIALRALGDGALLRDPQTDGMAFHAACTALGYADELDLAAGALDEAIDVARERGSIHGYARASAFRAHALYRRGDIGSAIADAQSALESAGHPTDINEPATSAILAQALVERGELDAATQIVDVPEAEALWGTSAPWAYFLESRGLVRLASGDAAGALEDFLACGKFLEALGVTNPSVVSWRSHAACVLARTERPGRASELLDEELALARSFGAPRALGIALRAAGVARGGEDGLSHLEAAVSTLRQSPAQLEYARALVELGHAQGSRAEGRPSARQTLRVALDIAHKRGAYALVARARSEISAAGGRTRRHELTGREALTPGERRVAEMAASGLTNREIAQALFVTSKAIEWHLRNAYQKLGISSRAQLSHAMNAGE